MVTYQSELFVTGGGCSGGVVGSGDGVIMLVTEVVHVSEDVMLIVSAGVSQDRLHGISSYLRPLAPNKKGRRASKREGWVQIMYMNLAFDTRSPM